MLLFRSTTDPPLEGETAIFLHGQERIWKGFINMHTVAKFATKAFLVSGSFEYLKEVGALYIYIYIHPLIHSLSLFRQLSSMFEVASVC